MENSGKIERSAGILMHISSLPSPFGIGTFGKTAYEFVDFVAQARHRYWQVLPLGPTTYGDSPYQSYSAFAGNPYFVDLEMLTDDGILDRNIYEDIDWGSGDYVDYEKVYNNRFTVLHEAYKNYRQKLSESRVKLAAGLPEYKKFDNFNKTNAYWLDDYALFMALKWHFNQKSWQDWDEDIKFRTQKGMQKYKELLADEIGFWKFVQYEFDKQWSELHAYANDQGIQIIGDIPIYVAFDSADTWSSPELFQFDEENNPVAVAGCPPDDFSATGQLWGNPLYNWEYHKKTEYNWWLKRILHCLKLYDVVRIDHFRGFDEYYSIPYGNETAVDGTWMPGPGMDLFRTIEEKLGKLNIIAEDLGFLTESVLQMLSDSGFPGMKVVQFAFDPNGGSAYLPHNYPENSVVYTGTHDNDTTRGWYHSTDKATRDFAKEYMNAQRLDEDDLAWDFIRLAMSSIANLCVTPMQDLLNLDGKARINVPSTLGGNWTWRMEKGQFDEKTVERLKRMTWLYERLPEYDG